MKRSFAVPAWHRWETCKEATFLLIKKIKTQANEKHGGVLNTHSNVYPKFPQKVPIFRAGKNAKFALQHPIIFGVLASPWTILKTEKENLRFHGKWKVSPDTSLTDRKESGVKRNIHRTFRPYALSPSVWRLFYPEHIACHTPPPPPPPGFRMPCQTNVHRRQCSPSGHDLRAQWCLSRLPWMFFFFSIHLWVFPSHPSFLPSLAARRKKRAADYLFIDMFYKDCQIVQMD